ncbi:DUF499 domain-containing protein [Thermococcus sp.]
MLREKIWNDVMDETLDEFSAPELNDVVSGRAHKIYSDAKEFFRRTYFSDSMLDLIEKVLSTLEGKGTNVFTVYSLFGGGKTHTLVTLYHILNHPDALLDEEVLRDYDIMKRKRLEHIAQRIKSLGKVNIAVIYGMGDIGNPIKPLDFGIYKVHTIWGYLAHLLGRYADIRAYDESLTVPDINSLRELLKEGKTLIMIDEVADYGNNLRRSNREDAKNYANNIPIFLERLSKAIIGTDNVLIVTLPIEVERGVLRETEKAYDKDYLEALWKAVAKLSGELVAPLRTERGSNDLIEVLKRRIFEKIDPNNKIKIIERYMVDMANEEIFGDTRDFLRELEVTYPFHPDYFTTMRTILERVPGLQKTRDLIKLTRKVVRKIHREEKEYSLVMPHHIDVFDNDLRGLLFQENYANYGGVVDVDLNPKVLKKYSQPELVKIIYEYIFLSTYPYDSPTPLTGFPDKFKISRGIYEVEIFEAMEWDSTKIHDAIEEIISRNYFIHLNYDDRYNVFWVWRIANVNQMVLAKKDELLRNKKGELIEKVTAEIKKAIEGKPGKGKKSKGEQIKITLFERKDVIFDPRMGDIVDDDSYKLLALYYEYVDEELLEDLILKHKGGTRKFRNTIVVTYPTPQGFNSILEAFAKVEACKEVKKEVDKIYSDYGKNVVKIQQSMIEHIENAAKDDLFTTIVQSFRKVAFPVNEGYRDSVKATEASTTSTSILETVYSVLISPEVEKVAEYLSFDELKAMLNIVGIDLSSRPYTFGEIRNYFRMNPALPMVEDERIKEALKEGLSRLEIGILTKSGKLVFKDVKEIIIVNGEIKKENTEQATIHQITLDDKILPKRIALEAQVSSLLQREETKTIERGKKKIRRKVEVFLEIDGQRIRLKDIVGDKENISIKDEDINMLVEGNFVVVITEEELSDDFSDFEIEISPAYVSAHPEELIEVKVVIAPKDPNKSFEVKLKVDYGKLKETNGIVPFETVWHLKAPRESDEFRLYAESKDVEHVATLRVEVISPTIRTRKLTEEHIGGALIKIEDIRRLEHLKILQDAIGSEHILSGTAVIKANGSRVSMDLDRIPLDVATQVIEDSKEYLDGSDELNVDVTIQGEITITELLLKKLSVLNDKVTFVVELRR